IDQDRRFGGHCAVEAAVRNEPERRPLPQEAVEPVGGVDIRRQHASAAMLCPRFRNERRGDLEAIGAVGVEIDRRHCARRQDAAEASCPSNQVVSSATGRPVAPFSLPSFQATPAMSRCAQSNFLAKRDRKQAAVMLPPARPEMFAKSAKLLASPSWYSSPSGKGQPRSKASSPAATSARESASLLLKMPHATWPSAITIAPVSVAISTTASGS